MATAVVNYSGSEAASLRQHLDNSKFEIIPGQLMTVKIIYEETNEIGVPESAVTIQGETAFVYVVNIDIML